MTTQRVIAMPLTVLAAMLLAACFLLPGKFDSTLDVRRDGRFSFAYKGEIVLVSPPGMSGMSGAVIKDDPAAPCFGHDPASDAVPRIVPAPVPPQMLTPKAGRVCTPAERDARSARIARTNAEAETRRKHESEQMAQIIGMDPNDATSMNAYAAQVAKQAGWRSVTYRGNGIFDVDFEQSGKLDRDFVFPVLPKASVLVPFVIVRKRADGAVLVNAPGFRGAPAQAFFNGFNKASGGVGDGKMSTGNGPNGRFVVTTDLAALTNNTDDGPTRDGGRNRLAWTVNSASEKIPEALIPLDR